MYEGGAGGVQGEAEDLVPMIMWVLSQAGVVSAEIEANYMWGLLLPSASDGEASYYLEAFHSAIHALKNLTPSPDSSPGNSLDSVRQVCRGLDEWFVLYACKSDRDISNGITCSRMLKGRYNNFNQGECWSLGELEDF